MEPIEKEKPTPARFLLMCVAFFGTYFGIKYGVLYQIYDGVVPWYFNVALIFGCLILAMALRRRGAN